MKIPLNLIGGLVVLLISLSSCQHKNSIEYSIATEPWLEAFGNHRAILEIDESAEAVELNLLWRRHDRDPHDKRFLIINAESGDTIVNIFRKEVDNERCNLIFGPVDAPGKYYFYYLPYAVQLNYGFYYKGHFIPEEEPGTKWIEANGLGKDSGDNIFPQALCSRIEARTEFDSFYPMEVIATEEEKKQFISKKEQEFILFPESRKYPIRMLDNVPHKWIKEDLKTKFSGEAFQNEYFVFQLGMWAAKKDISKINIKLSDLINAKDTIKANMMTCFNTEGYDPDGNYFTKQLDIEKGSIQPLWIGVDIAKNAKPGLYKGQITIGADNSDDSKVDVVIRVKNKGLQDRGDSEIWRHSRLRWLNSTAGIDKNPVKPFSTIGLEGTQTVQLSGSTINLSGNGLPEQINVQENEILSSAIKLDIKTSKSDITASLFELTRMDKYAGELESDYLCDNKELKVLVESRIESDGYIRYKYTLQAKENLDIKDVKLLIPLKKEIAEYMMGMGLPGTTVPRSHSSKWEGPHDSFWIGNTNGGLHCELRGSTYHGPLLNLYKPSPPESWHNSGKGGFQILQENEVVYAIVNSGARQLKEGQNIEFEFALIVTPIFELDPSKQFSKRYYHNGGDPAPEDEELDAGVEIINLHHANEFNPHINYPFIATEEMRGFIDKYHSKGKKVKIYYTIRELTNYVPEIWALRSLGDEIIGSGKGGGFPWLKEHFIDNYTPQWYHRLDSLKVDASVLTSTGESRWFNYYVEGLGWLVENMDIDGLYLDDVSFDRRMLKRMRKVMEERKPGCIFDLHSNTGFSKGPATQYTDFFPYVDKIWFGESFQYNDMSPANWLVEVSGIPFGLMGDMLHGGGNPWRGMIYGMTVRYPWTTEGVSCNPIDIWKVWDEFDIVSAEMMGYWDKKSEIRTNNKDVLLTYYQHQDKLLVSIASWANEPVDIRIKANWKKLGYNQDAKLQAPEIKNFQPKANFKLEDLISVEPGKGWLFIIHQ